MHEEVTVEECNVFSDLSGKSPLLKLISFFLAVITGLLCICMTILCLSDCKLSERYSVLKQALTQQTRSVGLPDDYEYDEDNIYMQELERERRAKMSYADRQKEDGILTGAQNTSNLQNLTKRSTNR